MAYGSYLLCFWQRASGGYGFREGNGMRYWELFFLTVGAGCFVGAVISPASWFAVAVGCASTWLGWKVHQAGGDT